jgi:hypothetical protein
MRGHARPSHSQKKHQLSQASCNIINQTKPKKPAGSVKRRKLSNIVAIGAFEKNFEKLKGSTAA